MIRPWEDAASDILEVRENMDRDSWELEALTESLDAVRKAALLENELNARISELEEHAGTLHEIIHGQTDVGSKKCNVCGWRK